MSWSYVTYDSKYKKEQFDCGKAPLNLYLKTQMSQDYKRKANVPTLAINIKNEVIAYYTLSAGEVHFASFPESLKKKIAPYPVPIARVGRLAVCKSMQGKKLGADVLAHAIRNAEKISEQLGIRALIVDAKDSEAEKFYLHFSFQYLETTTDRKTLFLMI
jgi:GNAT superfamily N-acetyltransferase